MRIRIAMLAVIVCVAAATFYDSPHENAQASSRSPPLFLGLLGPDGLPRDIVARLNPETVKIVQRREVQDWLTQQGGEPAAGTPGDFAAKIRVEMDKLSKVVRDGGVKLN